MIQSRILARIISQGMDFLNMPCDVVQIIEEKYDVKYTLDFDHLEDAEKFSAFLKLNYNTTLHTTSIEGEFWFLLNSSNSVQFIKHLSGHL